MLVLGAGLLITSGFASGSHASRNGGTFRVAVFGTFGTPDPALLDYEHLAPVLDATCARLMTYPDRRPPEGFRLVPEVAAHPPAISKNGKTYTFELRRTFRFSNGDRVRANAFEQAFKRFLKLNPPEAAGVVDDIVGADRFRAGQAASITGVTARGYRLVITLRKAVPDFAVQMAELPFCAVPPTLPIDPEGVTAFAAAGPYYITPESVRARRLVLKRNRLYHGRRPHHLASFVVETIGSLKEVLTRVERGQDDLAWGFAPSVYFDSTRYRRLVGDIWDQQIAVLGEARFHPHLLHPEHVASTFSERQVPTRRQLCRQPRRGLESQRVPSGDAHRPVPAAGIPWVPTEQDLSA